MCNAMTICLMSAFKARPRLFFRQVPPPVPYTLTGIGYFTNGYPRNLIGYCHVTTFKKKLGKGMYNAMTICLMSAYLQVH